jgi:beta-phosphoglucomutase-like phosphatase (HAD superfamily)
VLEALERIALPSCIASSATREHLEYTLSLTGLYERVRRPDIQRR